MNREIAILSTAMLDTAVADKAAAQGVHMDMLQFIDIVPVQSEDLQQAIAALSKEDHVVVFTSVHAVTTVVRYNGGIANWKIYCIDNTTAGAVKAHFGSAAIQGTASNAEVLAGRMIADKVSKAIFFCGDRRMDTLPDMLGENGIEVHELLVYSTVNHAHKLDKAYDGVLLFSPSGVESYFEDNTVMKDTVLFAIGDTTARAIARYSDNNIVVSGRASREQVALNAIAYFTKAPANK